MLTKLLCVMLKNGRYITCFIKPISFLRLPHKGKELGTCQAKQNSKEEKSGLEAAGWSEMLCIAGHSSSARLSRHTGGSRNQSPIAGSIFPMGHNCRNTCKEQLCRTPTVKMKALTVFGTTLPLYLWHEGLAD